MRNIIVLTLVGVLGSAILTGCRSRRQAVAETARADTVAVSSSCRATAVDVSDSTAQDMFVTRIEYYPPDSAGRSAVKAVSRARLTSHRRTSGTVQATSVDIDSLRATTASTHSEQVEVEPRRPLRLKIGLILVLTFIIIISWKIFKTLKSKTL